MLDVRTIIGTHIESVDVALNGESRIRWAQRMPQQIELIYGLSIELGGVTPNNRDLIVPGDDENLYLSFFDKAELFIESYRMSNMVFTRDSENKYLPVMIFGDIDLDRSLVINPTEIGDPDELIFVLLNLWYIPKDTQNPERSQALAQALMASRSIPPQLIGEYQSRV